MSRPNHDQDVLDYGYDAAQEPADAARDGRTLVAQAPGRKAKGKGKPQQALKKVRVLLVTYPADKFLAPVFARQVLKLKGREIAENVRQVNSWQELAKLLQEYESIERLVLLFHGTPGSLLIGEELKDLDKVGDIFRGHRPKVNRIDFEACNVGRGADKLVPFAKLFTASKVTGWNHSWITKPVEIKIYKNTEVQALERILGRYKGYLLKGSPTASELMRKPGKHTLIAEWFRLELSDEELPLPPARGELDTRILFKRRGVARTRNVRSDQVHKLREEYSKQPVRQLERVIISIF